MLRHSPRVLELSSDRNAQPHTGANPERVGHVVLSDSVNFSFAPDVVIGIRGEPQGVGQIVTDMFSGAKDWILRKRFCSVDMKIIILCEQFGRNICCI